MSVAFNSKSGEVVGDSCNQMANDDRSKNGLRSQGLVWWIGAAAVCLGFLLLAVILGIVAYNISTISHGVREFENLIGVCKKLENLIDEGKKYENQIYNLTKDGDVLRDERDQLRINSSTLTKEKEFLQSQYDTVVASQDKLQEEVIQLKVSGAEKLCHPGWIQFNKKCYYFSAKGVTKTWEDSRKDCQARRADLAIITTKDELDFVGRSYSLTWVGLSDKEQEGQWKWVDGTDLVYPGFWGEGEPNNSGGNEDCVEVIQYKGAWNDAPCDLEFPWVCED